MRKDLREVAFAHAHQVEGKYYCAYCGRESANQDWFIVEPKVPVACGGTDNAEDLVVLCSVCSAKKADYYKKVAAEMEAAAKAKKAARPKMQNWGKKSWSHLKK